MSGLDCTAVEMLWDLDAMEYRLDCPECGPISLPGVVNPGDARRKANDHITGDLPDRILGSLTDDPLLPVSCTVTPAADQTTEEATSHG